MPKGVCHDFNRLILNAIEFNEHNKLSENAVSSFYQWVICGFLNSILSPLLAGGTIVLIKFGPAQMFNFIDLIIENKINTFG